MNAHCHHFNNITRVEASERLMMVLRTSAENRCLKESEVTRRRSFLAARSHSFCIQATSVEEDAAFHSQPVAWSCVKRISQAGGGSSWDHAGTNCTSCKDASSVPILRGVFNVTANITPTFKLRYPRAITEVIIVLRRDAVHTSKNVAPHAF